MKTEFDVVIVGAGINGLACGAYLAKAGLEVLILEKRNECGPFALTEDVFGAGAMTDTHAAVCFLPMGPAYGDLELDRFGFELLIGKASGAAVWKDGKNLVFYYDTARMIEAIAQFSRRDAATAQRIGERLRPQLVDILARALFRAPSAEGLEFLWSLGAHAGLTPAQVRELNGVELLDRLYESEHVKMTFLAVADIGLFGDVTKKGEGAVAVLLGPALAVGTPRGGMHNLVHALVRCFRAHGGTLQLNAPVARVELAGGAAHRIVLAEESPYPAREFRARQAVVLHVTPPVALPMLGADTVRTRAPELHPRTSTCSTAWRRASAPRWSTVSTTRRSTTGGATPRRCTGTSSAAMPPGRSGTRAACRCAAFPGFKLTYHATYMMLAEQMPPYADLGLGDWGVRFVRPETQVAFLFEGGQALVLSTDPAKSRAAVAQLAPQDAAAHP